MEKLNEEAKRIIERAMPEEVRRNYESGKEIKISIIRNKWLHRWGDEARIIIKKGGNIIKNSLIECAWSWDEKEAAKEAANAVDYMVYGDLGENYKVEYSRRNWGRKMGTNESYTIKPSKEWIIYDGDFAIRFM